MPQGRTYTYADLEAMPEDNVRREIIDGELFIDGQPYAGDRPEDVVSPSPRLRHQEITGRLFRILADHAEAHRLGKVYVGPVDVALSDDHVVAPDVIFVADDQAEIMTRKNLRAAPALVVEVLSDARHDRVRKRDLYERFGVTEYWIADPEGDRLEVYRLRDGSYPKPELFEPGDSLTTARLPGLRIDVRALFAE